MKKISCKVRLNLMNAEDLIEFPLFSGEIIFELLISDSYLNLIKTHFSLIRLSGGKLHRWRLKTQFLEKD